jgi:hypothetical protein
MSHPPYEDGGGVVWPCYEVMTQQEAEELGMKVDVAKNELQG